MVSVRARLLRCYLRLAIKRRLAGIDRVDREVVRASRTRLDALARHLPAAPPGVRIEAAQVGGVSGLWVHPTGTQRAPPVLYLHGGAYLVGSADVYRALGWSIATVLGAPLFLADYRLAPEHPFPAALEDATRVAHALGAAQREPRWLLGGDSAGGGLALALVQSLRGAGAPQPRCVFCFSPWTDLTGSGDSVRANARSDPFLPAHLLAPAAAAYLAGADPKDPRASPLWGDLRGLPPLSLHVGADEILRDDAERYAARARAAGAPVDLRVWPGMPHAFPVFAPLLPEANHALEAVRRFTSRHAEA